MAEENKKRKKVIRVKAFVEDEIKRLLDIVEEILPLDPAAWKDVENFYNGTDLKGTSKPHGWITRDWEGLRAKFNSMHKMKSNSSSHVEKANNLNRKIIKKRRICDNGDNMSVSTLALHESSLILLESFLTVDDYKSVLEELRTSFEDAAQEKINNTTREYRSAIRITSNSASDVILRKCLKDWYKDEVATKLLSQRRIESETQEPPDSTMIDFVLSGGNDPSLSITMPIFRPFVSSTFTDTAIERDLMILLVYPFLSEYSRLSKVSFYQPSEMRWGIGQSLGVKHLTTATCLEELHRCQKAQGLNYLLILGDKYGSRFPRSSICTSEFESLLDVIKIEDDLNLVSNWYIHDTNHGKYNLKYLDDKDRESRYWAGEAARLHSILARAAAQVFPSDDPRHALYSISITHEEAYHGIECVDAGDRENSAAVVIRNFEGIENGDLSNSIVLQNWIDVTTNDAGASINLAAQTALWKEKEALFSGPCGGLDDSHNFNVASFTLPYQEGGLDISNPLHRPYAEMFLMHVTELMVKSIDKIANSGGLQLHNYCVKDAPFREAIAHNTFAVQKNTAFVHTPFTQDCVNRILQFVDPSSPTPSCPYFVVVGSSGTGKTSLMASALSAIREKWPHVKTIIRFLGTTHNSTDVVPLLQTLISHIRRTYNITIGNKPKSSGSSSSVGVEVPSSDYKELCNEFEEILNTIPTGNPLVLMLDSLDQLSVLNRSRRLGFLPKSLSNTTAVRIVLSTLPEKEFEAWDRLQHMYPPAGPPCVMVPPWTADDGEHVLESILKKQMRTLTAPQKGVLLNKFTGCPTCLFLVLSTFIAQDWQSTMDASSTVIGDSVQGCIFQIFDKLVEDHGKALVMNVLALITVSGGLSFDELLHILSLNDEVLTQVFEWWTPPIRRLPPLLLTRLLTTLDPFLVSRDEHGASGVFWYHRQLWTAARKYAIRSAEEECNYHRQIMEYFQGRWHHTQKPFATMGNKKAEAVNLFLDAVNGKNFENNYSGKHEETSASFSADRLVPSQPWIESDGTANARKLWMLPSNAVRSKAWMDAKEALCSMGTLECTATTGAIVELRQMYTEATVACETRLSELSELLLIDDGDFEEFYEEVDDNEEEAGGGNEEGDNESGDKTMELTEEQKDSLRLERIHVQDLLDHLLEFDSFLRLNAIALKDPAQVLQHAVNEPVDSLVRKTALKYFEDCHQIDKVMDDPADSSRTVAVLQPSLPTSARSLVMLQNLPTQSYIMSRVIAPITESKMLAFGHVHFSRGTGLVYAAVLDPLTNRLLVYEMTKAVFAFDVRLSGKPELMSWSPSGKRIACAMSTNSIYMITIAEGFDSVLFSTQITLAKDCSVPSCIIWAGDEHLLIGFNFTLKLIEKSKESLVVETVDVTKVIHAINVNTTTTSSTTNECDDSYEYITDVGADILSQIAIPSPGTCRARRSTQAAISPQGKYMVHMLDYVLKVLVLRGSARGSAFSCSLVGYGSRGGHGGPESLAFSYSGDLYITIRGEILIVKLGDTAESRQIQGTLKGKKSNNWTEFRACFPCPSENLIFSSDSAGSLWVLKSQGNIIQDVLLLPCHAMLASLIQCDESMRHLVTHAGPEVFLWDVAAIMKESEIKSKMDPKVSYDPRIIRDEVSNLYWHPDRHYFVASSASACLSVVLDGNTAEQFADYYSGGMGTVIYVPEVDSLLLGTSYGGNHFLWKEDTSSPKKAFLNSATYLRASTENFKYMIRLTSPDKGQKYIHFLSSETCDHIVLDVEKKQSFSLGKANHYEVRYDDLNQNSWNRMRGIIGVSLPKVVSSDGMGIIVFHHDYPVGVMVIDSSDLVTKVFERNNIIKKLKAYKGDVLANIVSAIPEDWFSDRSFVKEILQCNGSLYNCLSKEYKADSELVDIAVQLDGLVLDSVPEPHRSVDSIVEKAIQQNGMALKSAPQKYKENKQFVLMAVTQAGMALEAAVDALKKDKEIVLAALKSDVYANRFVPEELKNDPDIAAAMAVQKKSNNSKTPVPKSESLALPDTIGFLWKMDAIGVAGVAFHSVPRDVIAFIINEKENKLSSVLQLCRLSSGALLSTLELPGCLLLGYHSVHQYMRYDTVLNASSRIDATRNSTILAARGIGCLVVFYELTWDTVNSSATVRQLVHRIEGSSPASALRFKQPLESHISTTHSSNIRTLNENELTLAIGYETGNISLVKVYL